MKKSQWHQALKPTNTKQDSMSKLQNVFIPEWGPLLFCRAEAFCRWFTLWLLNTVRPSGEDEAAALHHSERAGRKTLIKVQESPSHPPCLTPNTKVTSQCQELSCIHLSPNGTTHTLYNGFFPAAYSPFGTEAANSIAITVFLNNKGVWFPSIVLARLNALDQLKEIYW